MPQHWKIKVKAVFSDFKFFHIFQSTIKHNISERLFTAHSHSLCPNSYLLFSIVLLKDCGILCYAIFLELTGTSIAYYRKQNHSVFSGWHRTLAMRWGEAKMRRTVTTPPNTKCSRFTNNRQESARACFRKLWNHFSYSYGVKAMKAP